MFPRIALRLFKAAQHRRVVIVALRTAKVAQHRADTRISAATGPDFIKNAIAPGDGVIPCARNKSVRADSLDRFQDGSRIADTAWPLVTCSATNENGRRKPSGGTQMTASVSFPSARYS